MEPQVTDTRTARPPQAVTSTGAAALTKRILIVDDDEECSGQLQELLRADPRLDVQTFSDGDEAIKELTAGTSSIVIIDLMIPGFDGMDLVREVQQQRLPATVIVMTGHSSLDQAILAVGQGAYDFITRPIEADTLRLVIGRALRERNLQDEIVQLRRQLESNYPVDLERPLPDILRETAMSIEQQYIRKALEQTHGHVGQCAKICGLSRRTVTAKIAEYQIDRHTFREG